MAEELPGDVAFEAASDFSVGLAFGAAAFDLGLGLRIDSHSSHDDGVDGSVELPVSGSVEPVSDCQSRPGGDWCGAGEHRECGFAADSSGMGPGADEGDLIVGPDVMRLGVG